MTLSIPRLGHVQRKEYLEEHYGTKTQLELSLACGVHVSTIKRDIVEWKASGEYDEWLDRRWHYYLESDTIPDIEKFRALTRLKEKRSAKLNLMKIEHSGKIGLDITKLLNEYSDIYEEEQGETQPIQENDTGEPMDTV
jgi:hypothetical protein